MKKRIISTVLIFSLAITGISARLFSISTNTQYASNDNSLFTRLIDERRGYIYDRNLKPLVNNEKRSILCAIPSKASYDIISEIKGEKYADETIGKRFFTTTEIDSDLNLPQSQYYKVFDGINRYGDSTALHLIGYVDSQSEGVCGIEKYFNDELKNSSGSLSISYSASATEKMLVNYDIEIRDNNYSSKNGIALTIDKNIQKVTENALKNGKIDKGAAIILDVNTFEILACASTPVYERDCIENYLESEDSPFINRALTAFPVGSVFKAVTAAAALECNIKLFDYTCNGAIEKSGNVFKCNKEEGHGKVTFNDALSLSCNPYFIELSTALGGEKLLRTAKLSGFGKSTDLGNGFYSDSGVLPDIKILNSEAAVGNFGFGQGYLTATPLQIAACFAVFANGGLYKQPTLYKGTVDSSGAFQGEISDSPKRIFKKETCKTINNALKETSISGTGKAAFSSLFSSCTKTATAQSGQYDKTGNEIKYCWFAGFFPAESPEYAICILKENGSSGGIDGAPVFKEIAEKIYNMN